MANIVIRLFVSCRHTNLRLKNVNFKSFGYFNLFSFSTSASSGSIPSFMKALVIHKFGKPSQLVVDTLPVPNIKENEILVRVEACGINPVDTYIREGFYNYLPKLPTILGKEVAGVVAKVGSNVTDNLYNLKEGDRVFCMLPNNGGYAEYVACLPRSVIPLSDKLHFSQGAGLFVAYHTAYRALIIRAKLKKNDTVFIHGASGGVGIAAIQIAKHFGAIVAGTAGTEKGLELIKEVGADFVINHRRKDHVIVSRRAMGDKGFDIIFENLADLYLGEDGHILAPGGRIAVVGCMGISYITPRTLMITEGEIIGVNVGAMTRDETEECTELLLEGIEDGWINPIVAKEYTFEEGPQAHEHMTTKQATFGKLVFRINHETS